MSDELNKIVEDWLFQSQFEDCDAAMLDIVYDEPELAWLAILQTLTHDQTAEQLALLAAGPLEILLSTHGPRFIDRVEHEAKHNERFNHLLGGVWQCLTPEDIWNRVQTVRKTVW